ncbi:MAG: hypothetical protein HW400_349 [Candidatus Levybacteria bacterium]|nr:hypothetical protein [Candidatus Levybacteria bacterium]
MKAIIGLIAVLLFLFCSSFVKSTFAVSVVISTPSSSLDNSQVLEVDTFLQCLGSCGDSYLRGVFFQTEGDYSSFTQNISGEWIGSTSDRTSYFKITSSDLVQGTWSGKLRLKFDSSQSNGNYFVKVGRYTGTVGSAATWSNFYPILIAGTVQASTPTPTSTPTPAPTSSPTNTPAPTKTPTATPAPNIPTTKPTVSSAPEDATSASVLGESTGNGLDISPPENLVSGAAKKPDTLFQVIIMMLGIALIAACAILTFRIIKKGQLKQNEE